MPHDNELNSVHLQFKLDYVSGDAAATVQTQQVTAGGHLWRVSCHPRIHGPKTITGNYLSLYFALLSSSSADTATTAVIEAFALQEDGELHHASKRCVVVFPSGRLTPFAWERFGSMMGGRFTVVCGIIVLREPSAPPSSSSSSGGLVSHLGCLLDCGNGSDVSFSVGGETFHAHRAVLAARSSVFKAELFGPMSESTMPCIKLQDMEPETFRFLLRFIYTDALPGDEEAVESSSSSSTATTEVFRNLLAAADRYDIGRLKLACAKKLYHNLSTDTVAETLGFADQNSCPELKRWCLDFCTMEKNFNKVAVTDGYFELRHRFPSVIDEIKERLHVNEESRKRGAVAEQAGSGAS